MFLKVVVNGSLLTLSIIMLFLLQFVTQVVIIIKIATAEGFSRLNLYSMAHHSLSTIERF